MGGVFRIVALLVAALVMAAAIALTWAHAAIRSIDPPLPPVEEWLAAAGQASDLPLRMAVVNTARQRMPRAAVLERSRDPNPEAPYVMAFPAFVLEWSDGRRLLIDAGMDRAAALAFGRPLEILAGAAPIEPLGGLAGRLGPRAAGGAMGVVLTHLHSDHTQGLAALCAVRAPGAPPLLLWQTRAQATRSNYTTRAGRRDLAAAPCLEPRQLDPAPLMPVPGFPGVLVVHAAGHTPGSQMVLAFLRDGAGVTGTVFSGDVVNHVDGARTDVPKPLLYRVLGVPEFDARLGRMRRLLRTLEQRGLRLVVSHDLAQIESLGIPSLPGEATRPASFAPQEGG